MIYADIARCLRVSPCCHYCCCCCCKRQEEITSRLFDRKGMMATRSPSLRKSIFRCWLLLLFSLLSLTELQVTVLAADAEAKEECDNTDKLRLVTREELATKTGENGSAIWLSILGKVYDVTAGKDFYGPGSGYAAFAGTDASVPFVTGKFTAEEAAKGLDTISYKQVGALNDWVGFYGKSDKYNYVGVLVDPRFYDEEGKPNQPLVEHQKLAEERKEKDRLWKEKQKQKTPAKKAPAKKIS